MPVLRPGFHEEYQAGSAFSGQLENREPTPWFFSRNGRSWVGSRALLFLKLRQWIDRDPLLALGVKNRSGAEITPPNPCIYSNGQPDPSMGGD